MKSSVHQNTGLSVIDKFNYLRALLEGAAARSIQGLALMEGNYCAAIDILKEQFGKPQHIIADHMKDFMKIPSCTSDKPSQLRSIYDKIYANVRGLEALGIGAEQYESFLIPIMMDRLPADVCLQIARITTKDIWEIDELLQVLRTKVEAKEISDRVKVTEIRNPVPPSQQPSQQKSTQSTASALVACETGNHNVFCAYCKENHYSASCGKVTRTSERRDILRKEGRCFVCLMKGHRASKCQGAKKCHRCGRRHHQSLCELQPVPRTENQEAKESEDVPTTSNNVAKSKNNVLLQTACTRIYTADDQLIPVRILLDNRSQCSYITNALKSRLRLTPVRQERLSVNTFGSAGCKREQCDVLSVTLLSVSGENIEIQVLSFPTICSALKTPVAVNQYPHLQDLDLADVAVSGDQSNQIDILIGSDYYWCVITGDIIRGKSGPVALSSHFGWLLSGPANPMPSEHTISTLIIDGCIDAELLEHTDQLSQALCRFWDTEAIGVVDQCNSGHDDFPQSSPLIGEVVDTRLDYRGSQISDRIRHVTHCV